MGVFDAPAWVLAAWRRSLQDVGATADQATLEAYGERMIDRWSAPERSHHNLKRLIVVLARVDELAPETHDPDVVRLAAWYHGAAFDAAAPHAYAHRGGVDEPASAELARTELTELGVPVEVVERIAALILSITRHSAPKDDIDAQALCDADLGILAAEPQRYAAYRKQVRAEYAHIPRADYVRARLAIVTKLLARPQLFQSPMAQDWEDAARENLTAELDRLTAEAAKLPPEAPVEGSPAEAPVEGSPAGACEAAGGPIASRAQAEEAPAGRAGAEEAPAGRAERHDEHDGAGSLGEGTSPDQGEPQAVGDGVTPASAATPSALPEEVHLPDGGPGPAGFEPVEVEDPGASERAPESVAQRSQRRWAEHLAARETAERNSEPGRRRGTTAPSPLEPGVGEAGTNEGVEGETEDFDETSSLSRPPKMPAIKRRPRDDG